MGLLDDIKNIIRLAIAIVDCIAVIAMVIILLQNMEAIKQGDIPALNFVIVAILLIAINAVTFGLTGSSPRPP
jgi:hypothetical protein